MSLRVALAYRLLLVPAVFGSGCTRGPESGATGAARNGAEATSSVAGDSTVSPDMRAYSHRPIAMRIDSSEAFETIAERIAREYKSWRRVSDEAGWAVTDCLVHPPSGVLHSESGDEATHGQKLYFLFANMPWGYRYGMRTAGEPATGIEAEQPVGQAVVKEAWRPVACDAPAPRPVHEYSERSIPDEYVERDGRWYRTGEPAGVFIMFKLDPATAETDRGWVYATTDPESGEVLQSGRIANCMKCHERAPFDRLFGSERARNGAAHRNR